MTAYAKNKTTKENVEVPEMNDIYKELVKNSNEYTAVSLFDGKIKTHYFKKIWTLDFRNVVGSVQKKMNLPTQYFPLSASVENVAMFTQIVGDGRDSTPHDGIIVEPWFSISNDNNNRVVVFDFYCEEPDVIAEVTIDILLIDMRAIYQ